MTTSFEKILSSRTFQFLIGPDGPDRKPSTIHSAIVDDLSAPLAALMNGSMHEAKKGIATLDDIDPRTFVRFCEYAYTGDYTPAQNQPVPATSKADEAKTCSSGWDIPEESHWGSKKKKRKVTTFFDDLRNVENYCGKCGGEANRQSLWDEFKRRDYSVVSPRFRPRQNLEDYKDDDGPLLCHAQVYVFADRYDLAGLRILALDKLHQALCSFKEARGPMGKVIELTQYSYSNDNTRDNETGKDIDALRSMVVHFAVCLFDTLAKDEKFLDLMEERGRLARDLTGLLGKGSTAAAK